MPASGGPAFVVTHLEMGSSSRHPILGTGRPDGAGLWAFGLPANRRMRAT
jgi:hypothetical protein